MLAKELAEILLKNPNSRVRIMETEYIESSESTDYHICDVVATENDSEELYLIYEEDETINDADSPDEARRIERILYSHL